jgi:hypothetical protein
MKGSMPLRLNKSFVRLTISLLNCATIRATGREDGGAEYPGNRSRPREEAVPILDDRATGPHREQIGVTNILSVNLSGFIAWWLWRRFTC